MSARTTPSGTGDTTSPPRRYAEAPTASPAAILAHAHGSTSEVLDPAPTPVADPAPDPDPVDHGVEPATDPDAESRLESRRALRAARRQRRHVMVGCAVVIAVCLVLTVLIVGFARDRRPGSQTILPNLSIGAPDQPALAHP